MDEKAESSAAVTGASAAYLGEETSGSGRRGDRAGVVVGRREGLEGEEVTGSEEGIGKEVFERGRYDPCCAPFQE